MVGVSTAYSGTSSIVATVGEMKLWPFVGPLLRGYIIYSGHHWGNEVVAFLYRGVALSQGLVSAWCQ